MFVSEMYEGFNGRNKMMNYVNAFFAVCWVLKIKVPIKKIAGLYWIVTYYTYIQIPNESYYKVYTLREIDFVCSDLPTGYSEL